MSITKGTMIKVYKTIMDVPSGFSGVACVEKQELYYFLRGKYHNLTGPAYEGSYGNTQWWENDRLSFPSDRGK